MRWKAVPSTELTSKTLRAQDYVFHPNIEADKIIVAWLDETGLRGTLHRGGPFMKDLKRKVRDGLERAMKEQAT